MRVALGSLVAILVLVGCGRSEGTVSRDGGIASTASAIASMTRHLDSVRTQPEPRDSNPYVIERRWIGTRIAIDLMSAESNIIDGEPILLVGSAAGYPPVVLDRVDDIGRLLAQWWPADGDELLRLCELMSYRFLVKGEIQSEVSAVRRALVAPKPAVVMDVAALQRLEAPAFSTHGPDSMSVSAWFVHDWYTTRADCAIARRPTPTFLLTKLDTLAAIGFVGRGP